jgi:hypothetical protein
MIWIVGSWPGPRCIMTSSVVDCEVAHQCVPSHRGSGVCKVTGRLRYGTLAPGCITQSAEDGRSRGGELKSPSRMGRLPSESKVSAYGGVPLKCTSHPVSFVMVPNRVAVEPETTICDRATIAPSQSPVGRARAAGVVIGAVPAFVSPYLPPLSDPGPP